MPVNFGSIREVRMKVGLLNQGEYTVQRERLLASDCIMALRRYALQCRSRILITAPEIDQNGCDFLLEDDFYYLPIQLKSVDGNPRSVDETPKSVDETPKSDTENGTSSWKVHPRFFAPNFQDSEQLRLTVSEKRLGLPGGGGGVLLQEFVGNVEKPEPLKIQYYYTDIFYIMAVYRSFWNVKHFTPKKAKELLEDISSKLSTYDITSRVTIPKIAFIPILGPAAMLSWRMHIEPENSIIGSNYTNIFKLPEKDLVDEASLRHYRFILSRFISSKFTSNFKDYLSQERFYAQR